MPKRPLTPSGASCGEKGRENFFPEKNPRNLLISLDSDERIQGNPRKSNTGKPENSQQNGHPPRKSKRTDRIRGKPAAPSRTRSGSPKCKPLWAYLLDVMGQPSAWAKERKVEPFGTDRRKILKLVKTDLEMAPAG
jgi:hypothetical protein